MKILCPKSFHSPQTCQDANPATSLFSTINRKWRLADQGSDRGKTSHQSFILKILFNAFQMPVVFRRRRKDRWLTRVDTRHCLAQKSTLQSIKRSRRRPRDPRGLLNFVSWYYCLSRLGYEPVEAMDWVPHGKGPRNQSVAFDIGCTIHHLFQYVPAIYSDP